jgi:ABC-type transporter lipoprotein component MlaA
MRTFLVSADTFNSGSIHAYLVCRGPHESHLSRVIERMQAALEKLNPRALPVLAVTPLTSGYREIAEEIVRRRMPETAKNLGALLADTRDGRFATMWAWSVNDTDNRTLMALH